MLRFLASPFAFINSQPHPRDEGFFTMVFGGLFIFLGGYMAGFGLDPHYYAASMVFAASCLAAYIALRIVWGEMRDHGFTVNAVTRHFTYLLFSTSLLSGTASFIGLLSEAPDLMMHSLVVLYLSEMLETIVVCNIYVSRLRRENAHDHSS